MTNGTKMFIDDYKMKWVACLNLHLLTKGKQGRCSWYAKKMSGEAKYLHKTFNNVAYRSHTMYVKSACFMKAHKSPNPQRSTSLLSLTSDSSGTQSQSQIFPTVFFLDTVNIKWAKHNISPTVRFFTFQLVLTVTHVSRLTEKTTSLTLKSEASWFRLRPWKQKDWLIHTSVSSFIQSSTFASDIKTTLHGFCCPFRQWYNHLAPILGWQNKAADSLVTLCKYIYFAQYIYIFYL